MTCMYFCTQRIYGLKQLIRPRWHAIVSRKHLPVAFRRPYPTDEWISDILDPLKIRTKAKLVLNPKRFGTVQVSVDRIVILPNIVLGKPDQGWEKL